MLSFLDRNNNRERDRDEPWDSTQVVVSVSRPVIDLLAIVKDSTPPRLTTAARDDTTSIRATFDRPVDPSQTLGPANFRVQRADSTVLPVIEVLTLRQAAARTEGQNTARTDTAARADTSARPQPPSPAVPLPAPVNPGRPPAPPPAVAQKPKLPPPENGVVLRLPAGTPLPPGTTYRVTATGIRNLLGRPGTSTRTFTIPRAVVDTSRRAPAGAPRPGVSRDTTRRPP